MYGCADAILTVGREVRSPVADMSCCQAPQQDVRASESVAAHHVVGYGKRDMRLTVEARSLQERGTAWLEVFGMWYAVGGVKLARCLRIENRGQSRSALGQQRTQVLLPRYRIDEGECDDTSNGNVSSR
jgi:hypothetical protein